MNYTLPLESEETTAGFIMDIFHMMKQTLVEDNVRHAFVQLGLRLILTRVLTPSSSTNGSSEKVQDSPHFGKEITLWRSYRREGKLRYLGELTRRCGPSGIVDSNHPLTMSRDNDHYSFTSQIPIVRAAM
jgi:hypothetical protein